MTPPTDRSARADPDFAICPHCYHPLQIASEENLYGKHPITLTLDGAGDLVQADWTVTEIWWDTSATTNYFCLRCETVLPEAYQRVLDAVLGNRREAIALAQPRRKESQAEISEAIARQEDAVDTYRQARALWRRD